jgi:hypothetical protein
MKIGEEMQDETDGDYGGDRGKLEVILALGRIESRRGEAKTPGRLVNSRQRTSPNTVVWSWI